MKNYKLFLFSHLTYSELIAYAYSFGEVFVTKNIYILNDNNVKCYFKDGKFMADGSLEDDEGLDKGVGYHTLIPYAEGSWDAVKNDVKELSEAIARQRWWIQPKQADPLKLDYNDVLKEVLIFEGSRLLMNLADGVDDCCVAYICNSNFILPSHYLVVYDELDKAMRKWEKKKSIKY